jgi:glycosyltransferase involved in cell wall biosynthesis
MNILFCYRNWLNPQKGGVPRISDTLAKYFVSEGHVVYYLTYQNYQKDDYQFPAKIYTLPDPVFFSKRNQEYYHKLLHELSINLMINHDSSNERARFFLNTGKHPAKKISLYHTDPLNGLYKTSELSGGFRLFLYRIFPDILQYVKTQRKKKEINYLLENSDRLVFLSEEFKKQVSAELRINTSKIQAINNPCFSYNFLNTSRKKKQILFVARIDYLVKRPDKMLNIWSCLQNEHPDWELIFLGDGPDRMKVENLAKSMNLKNVRFEGIVDPVPYYKEASIICMTSDYEGFGLALLEGMQFGVIPIAFNNWISLKDLIVDMVTGIIVPTDDILQYVEKLNMLMSDENIRIMMSYKAIDQAKKFGIERIGPKWIKLINEINWDPRNI